MKKRVVITGLGAITPIGNNVNDFFNNLIAGQNGISKITHFNPEHQGIYLAGIVKNYDEEKYYISKKVSKRLARFSKFAVSAATEAYYDSGLNTYKELDPNRFGCIVSSGIGGILEIENHFKKSFLETNDYHYSRVRPIFLPTILANMAGGNVAISLNARGYSLSVVTACATGNNSIGEAFKAIQRGDADVMIAGGADAAITEVCIASFRAIGALSTAKNENEGSIPWNKNRNGFVLGEGAGIIILEELKHALKRKTKIYGEIVGYGSTSDAFHIIKPDGKGGVKAIENALADANIKPDDINYINAHGTSTLIGDKSETDIIKAVFGKNAYNIPVSSTKSMIGHLLGAAGGVEAIVCLKTLEQEIIHPTINYKNPDSECDLNYVPNQAIKKTVQYAISNSFGFGGHNAILIFKKWQGQ